MGKDWECSTEEFDRFLAWLDHDRDKAGEKYEAIRRNLVMLVARRGCPEPGEVADEAINRVIRRVARGLDEIYQGEPAAYFITVSYRVCEERKRRPPLTPLPPDPPAPPQPEGEDDGLYDCLDWCLDKLSRANRDLVLRYYKEDTQSRIDDRKRLAEELGIDRNALRIRIFRIRVKLGACIESCLAAAA